MTEAAFRPRLVNDNAPTLDGFFPAWMAQAACSVYSSSGAPWSWMFYEELSEKLEYPHADWPDKAEVALEVCARCPVRRRCAEWAYESEKAQGTEWWSGEFVEQDRRFGIFGGLPGRIRERLANHPNRIEEGERWFAKLCANRRFKLVGGLDRDENLSA